MAAAVLGIIGVLEDALGPASDLDDRQTAAEMLAEMAKRRDLYETAARRIDALQAQVRGAGRRTYQKPPPRRSKPPPVAPHPQPRPAASLGGVKTHQGLAITTAIITFIGIILAPIGIAALINSSRVTSRLVAGDAAGARKASSRVVLFFWLAVAIWLVIIIIEVAVAASQNPTSTAMMVR